VYLNYRYKFFSIIILRLSRGAAARVHLNVKVRHLRDIPCFVPEVKKF
jgi:hypothetical protein